MRTLLPLPDSGRCPRRATRALPGALLVLPLLLPLLFGPDAAAQTPAPTLIPNLPHFEWQNPSLTGYKLTDLCPLDSLTAYVAGARGTVLKTTDGGHHWQPLNTGTRCDIRSISFFDAQHGWIAYTSPYGRGPSDVGGPGEVRYTADGGQTWTRRLLRDGNNTERLWSIRAFSPVGALLIGEGARCGGATPCGGALPNFSLRTTNAGMSWQRPAPGAFGGGLQSELHYFSPTSWIISRWPDPWDFGLFRTDDAGRTTRICAPDTLNQLYYKQAQFFNAQHGWILGSRSNQGGFCLLYHTRDGGRTWSTADTVRTTDPQGNRTPADLLDMTFSDPARGVALSSTELFTTLDSGRTWTRQPFVYSSPDEPLRLRATPDGSVWLIQTARAQIWRCRGVGQPWQRRTTTQTDAQFRFSRQFYPRPPQFLDARHGWAMVRNDTALLRTTDRGAHWQRVPVPRPPQLDGRFTTRYAVEDFHFVDPDTGYVCLGGPTVFSLNAFWVTRTTDGGRTWGNVTQMPVAISGQLFQPRASLGFTTARRGAFVTEEGQVLVTQDGGLTWQAPSSGTRRPLVRVAWRDSLTAYATGATVAGDSAVLVKTTDGGFTWTRLPNPANFHALSPFVIAPDGALWGDGAVTRDEGQTIEYSPIDSATNYYGTSPGGMLPTLDYVTLGFSRARHALAFNLRDYYRTHDNGVTWQRFAAPGDYYGYNGGAPTYGSAIDDYNACIINQYGSILHYSEKYLQTDTSANQRLTYCTGDILTLAFDTTGFFSPAEDSFRIELSNKMGRFRPHETTLLPLVGRANASPLRATLPATLAPGTRYRLRVIRADSSVLGGDNQRDVTIWQRPAAGAVAPADSARFCQGDSVLLTAPAGFAAYHWTSGDTTATLWVTQANVYAVQVASGGRCFGPLSPPVTVRVTPTPPAPGFSVQPQTSGIVVLTSASPTGNQWFFNGQPIPGATAATYAVTTATQSGAYALQVTQRGCASPLSPPQTITVTGTAADAVAALGLTLVPNPAQQRLRLTSGEAVQEVTLTDLSGRVLLRRNVGRVTSVELALPRLPTGTYLLTATTPSGRSATRRLLIAP